MQVIDHDDGIIHDQTKANSQAGQRVEVNIHLEEIEHDSTKAEIDQNAQEKNSKVFEIAIDQKDKDNQDQNGKPRPLVDLIQFLVEKLGIIPLQANLNSAGRRTLVPSTAALRFCASNTLLTPSRLKMVKVT